MLIDNNAHFREQLKFFLSSAAEIVVVGEAESGEQALAQVSRLAPEVILLDVGLAGMNGLETANRLKKRWPQAGIIMLSRYDLDVYRQAARSVGASAYVVKRNLIDELLPTIRQAVMAQAVEGNCR